MYLGLIVMNSRIINSSSIFSLFREFSLFTYVSSKRIILRVFNREMEKKKIRGGNPERQAFSMAHSATCSHLAPSADRVCKPLDSEEEQGPHCCHLKVEYSFHRVQPWQTHREELWRFSTAGCPCSRWREGEYWLICILGLSWQQEQATLTINLKHQYILKKKKKDQRNVCLP